MRTVGLMVLGLLLFISGIATIAAAKTVFHELAGLICMLGFVIDCVGMAICEAVDRVKDAVVAGNGLSLDKEDER